MKWYRVITHDYMDEKPEIGYRLFKDENEANAYVKHMQTNWSGGITYLDEYATQNEILTFVKKYNITLDKETENNINNTEYYK